jgi:hypothetical protein
MPLNPKLYNGLRRAFGEVRIAKEGEPMAYKVVTNPLTHRQGTQVTSGGEDYKVCCPFCGDTRFRLEISHRWDTTDPVTGARFGRHLMRCYNDGCDANLDAPTADRVLRQEELQDRMRPYVARALGLRTPVAKPKRLTETKLPGKCVPITQLPADHPAILYLLERDFDPARLEQEFRLVFCLEDTNENVSGRIIIPVYRENKLVGWQARYVGEPPADYIPKYYTMPGLPKRQVLYNYDVAMHTRFGIIVEGVTDVWRVGRQGVAILGSTMSNQQIALAKAAWGETGVGLALDPELVAEPRKRPDRPTSYEKIVERLSDPTAFKWGLLKIQLALGTDPGKLRSDELWRVIQIMAQKAGYAHPIQGV